MNKISKTILILLISVFVAGNFLVFPVNAQTDELVVEYWTGTEWKKWLPSPNSFPIFNETNFFPGESVTRLIRVTNNSNSTKKIATQAINVRDRDKLGDALILEIKKGADTLYNKTLSEFFTAGEVYLSDLNGNGAQTQYDFTITFDFTSGNSFQGKSLSFDILIGFLGEVGGGGGTSGGVTGSGGGGFLPSGLTIQEESVRITNVDETSVTITWLTSYFSTSQVIYDTVPGKFNLVAGPPNYGYAYSKEGDDSGLPKVTFHSVTITGLTSGTTYYYRTVSHGSLAISQERSFTTLEAKAKEEAREEIKEKEIKEKEIQEEIIPPKEEIPAEEVALIPAGEEVEKPEVFVTEKAAPTEKRIVTVPLKKRVPEGGLSSLFLASLEEIGETPWMVILVVFCIIGLVIIGIREWELARKKRKNIF